MDAHVAFTLASSAVVTPLTVFVCSSTTSVHVFLPALKRLLALALAAEYMSTDLKDLLSDTGHAFSRKAVVTSKVWCICRHVTLAEPAQAASIP